MEYIKKILSKRKLWKGIMNKKLKIFAGTGTHKLPFTRFLTGLEKLCKENSNFDIFVQKGNTPFTSLCLATVDFLGEDEMLKRIQWADVVIVHAGAGYIINALTNKKPLVVVPRRKRYDEHTDDHQWELAQIMQKEGKCIIVDNINELKSATKKALLLKPKVSSENMYLTAEIEKYLIKIEQAR